MVIIEAVKEKKTHIRFPLRIDLNFNEQINEAVFKTKAGSKHKYILEAIEEKIKKDLGRVNT